MKLLAFLIVILNAMTAVATDTLTPIGTQCIYQGEAQFAERYEPITFTVTLKSINEQGVGLSHILLRTQDGKSVETNVSGKINTLAETERILSECQENNGTLETIVVAAGKFETCKIYLPNYGYTWIAKVPFDSVKLELDSRPMRLELRKCKIP